MLGLPSSKRVNDFIYVDANTISKMTHFISCHKIDNATHITELFFRKVVRLHGMLKTIVNDKDIKFLSYF